MNEPGSFKKEFEWAPFIKNGALAAICAKILWMGIDALAPVIAKVL